MDNNITNSMVNSKDWTIRVDNDLASLRVKKLVKNNKKLRKHILIGGHLDFTIALRSPELYANLFASNANIIDGFDNVLNYEEVASYRYETIYDVPQFYRLGLAKLSSGIKVDSALESTGLENDMYVNAVNETFNNLYK